MKSRARIGILLWVFVHAIAGCGGSGFSSTPPTAPSAVQQAGPAVVQQPVTPPVVQPYCPSCRLVGAALYGLVYERTPSGQIAPVAGTIVYCNECGAVGHTWTACDAEGFYSFSGDLAQGGGVWLTSSPRISLWVGKNGYNDPRGFWAEVYIDGDTRFDIEVKP